MYSIIATAKENGLKPHNYLVYLFEQLSNVDTEDPVVIEFLMPWSETLPQGCKMGQAGSA